ncbi:UNVERIFIED_CONTAM: NAD(P)-dependent dehydrogenase (short-subunit alcohol dehydrogenase family) [Brevibacillus sp. OAP136]
MKGIICITGASSGIGLATALKLAREGFTVYAGTRQLQRELETHKDIENLHFLEMDVTKPDTLRQAFYAIEQRHGHLDVLFANAGYGFLKALGQASMQEIKDVFETNFFGVIHTIQLAEPLLRKADAGYIIATSSVGGLVGQPLNEVYCASKFALEGLLESMATYYKPTFNIDITLLEPGAIATNFGSTVLRNIEETGGIPDDVYKPIADAYLGTYAKRNTAPQTAESVAEVVLGLLQMETKPLRVRTSDAAEAFAAHKTAADPMGLEGTAKIRKLLLGL